MRAQRSPRLVSVLLAVLTTLAISGATAAAASSGNTPGKAAAAPARDDSTNEPVYFLKGYLGASSDATGTDCLDGWRPARDLMRNEGWSGPLHLVGYYKGDINCDVEIAAGDKNVSIKELGRLLAWDIYDNYSKNGQSVDLIGHSMGGLIAQAAITGVEQKLEGWPDYIYVEDAVTIAAPHRGLTFAYFCGLFERTQQCRDMRPGSDFLDWAGNNPQSARGTDWTLIGSADDQYAYRSSLGMTQADHKVRYWAGNEGWNHANINEQITGTFTMQYRNQPGTGLWEYDPGGAAPARVAMNALYWSEKW